jgi:pyruvate kinase
MRSLLPETFLISKIESKRGVENFDEILAASDGIMIARGDLGVAESLEKVPPMQKDFTNKAKVKDKFLITATEMLLSMVDNPEPTRAEVSDVANAVFDNSSAVMLSEETAIGKYPVETVIMMRKIIVEAEKWQYSHQY